MTANAPDAALLADMERKAVDLARGAGGILSKYFGGNLDVEFKDDRQRDPVTNADTEAQAFLERGIAASFPDHGVLGEEDEANAAADNAAARDFLWVLDPLDGTKNFLHGLPVYASSVGVLYRGEPVVGAVYTPWPSAGGGVVHHARRGGGAFTDGVPIAALSADAPSSGQLATIPGSFDWLYRFDKPVRGKTGDPRVTGSIAYELVLVARGVTQYMYTSNPHMWDVAGGVAVAMEAGCALMVGERSMGPMGLFPRMGWRESRALFEGWRSGETAMKELRGWARPLVLGNPAVAGPISASIGWRRNPRLRARMWRRRRRRRG